MLLLFLPLVAFLYVMLILHLLVPWLLRLTEKLRHLKRYFVHNPQHPWNFMSCLTFLDAIFLQLCRMLRKTRHATWLWLRLAGSGDVHPNPGPSTQARTSIKVLSMNVNSIAGLRKRTELHNIIQQHNPDIVTGCESKLSSDNLDHEVFPQGFTVIRRDRPQDHHGRSYGGGVFILVRSDLEVNVLDPPNNCEIAGADILFPGRRKPLRVYSFYRPNEHDQSAILGLRDTLSKIQNPDDKDILLLGDFNARGITWSHTSPPRPSSTQDSMLLEVFEDFNLQQLQLNPTRATQFTKSVLDLLLTNTKLVSHVNVVPGMSDHSAVTAKLHITVPRTDNHRKTIYLYHRTDWNKISAELFNFSYNLYFVTEPLHRSVSNNWALLKS